MTRFILIAATALTLGACDGERALRITSSHAGSSGDGVLKVVTALQCPDTQGGLTRKGPVSADGAICTYGGPKGAEVTLHLVSLETQNADQVLKAFETQLSGAMPDAAAKVHAQQAETAPAMDGAPAASGDAAHIRAPGMRIDARDDQASVRLPGLRVEADGDRATVRIAGIRINADDQNASISAGSTTDGSQDGVTINARDDAAEVRTRASGQATRMSYVLTNDQPSPDGWRLVGYEARGPVGGPLVVATVRAKAGRNDNVFDDAKRLVALNVGD
jgi:hypothetical protein